MSTNGGLMRSNGQSLSASQQSAATGDRRRRPCCSAVQYRAILLIIVCGLLIFVAEYWDVAYYLVFVGSIGIFMGIFLILLDISLYMQARSDRSRGRRRFGAREEEVAGEGRSSVWTTASNTRRHGPSDPYSGQLPDYDTTVSQPDLFPFPSYLQHGISSSAMTSSPSSTEITAAYENDVHAEDEDKLPTYEEVMEGGRLPTIQET